METTANRADLCVLLRHITIINLYTMNWKILVLVPSKASQHEVLLSGYMHRSNTALVVAWKHTVITSDHWFNHSHSQSTAPCFVLEIVEQQRVGETLLFV